MKTAITILLILSMTVAGQSSDCYFKITSYNSDEIISEIKFKFISWTDKLDLNYYKTNFYEPYNFPRYFVDLKYKDETVVTWRDSIAKKEYFSNVSYTYRYDNLSRVTKYSYSGCMICATLPYSIGIYYDSLNRPVRLVNENPEIIPNESLKDDKVDSNEYRLKYDDKGNIIQVQYYSKGKLSRQIDKL